MWLTVTILQVFAFCKTTTRELEKLCIYLAPSEHDLPVYEWYFTEEFLGLAKTGTTSIPPGERHTHGHSNNYRQSDNHRRHNHYYSIPSQLHGDIRGNVTLLSLGEVWLSQKLVGR